MHRGLRLGMIWFGALVAIGGFVWLVTGGVNVLVAALMALILFLALAWYPIGRATMLVPFGDTSPRSSVRWSDREIAAFTFAFLIGATIVMIGAVREEIVLGGAGGLAAFFLLGLFPAVWMRRRRRRAPPKPAKETREPKPRSDELHPVTKVLNVLLWIVLVPAVLGCLWFVGELLAVELGVIQAGS